MVIRGGRVYVIVTLMVAIMPAILGVRAYGEGEGGNQGGEAISCGYNLCSSYGATWRWEKWDDPDGDGRVYIAGTVNGEGTYSPAYATDTYVTGCANEGGYWRYAMVASATKGRRTDGSPVYKGEQVGTTSIGNVGSLSLRSEKFSGGGMRYIEENDHGKSWTDIQRIYESAQQVNPAKFYRGWNSTSSLAWFCAPNPDIEYFAESNASVNGNAKLTGVVKSGEVEVSSVKIKKGESVALAFSHNIYSSNSVNNVDWQIQRRLNVNFSNGDSVSLVGFNWSAYFDFKGSTVWGPYIGKNNITQAGNYSNNAKYTVSDADRRYQNGGKRYLTRDELNEVTFKKPGTYSFCETMYIGASPVKYTSACVTIEVGDCDSDDSTCLETEECYPGDPSCPPAEDVSLCQSWEHADYDSSYYNHSGDAEGWTFTRSGVRNLDSGFDWAVSNGKDNNFESKPVYARPGQEIEWNHCYYPGIQKMADRATVTTSWQLCWADQDTELINNNITWDNKYTVKAFYKKNSSSALRTDMLQGGNGDGEGGPFDVGDDTIQTWGIDTYTVESGSNSKAGSILTETMTTGSPQYVKISEESHSTGCCDGGCTCGEGENEHSCCCDSGDSITIHVKNVTYSKYSDTAMVKIPYNYDNDIAIGINRTQHDGVVYSGETIDVYDPTVYVKPRYNSTIGGSEYATKVDGGEVRVVTYVANMDQTGFSTESDYGSHGSDLCQAILSWEQCDVVDDKYKTFNDPEDLGGSTESVAINKVYNAFDSSAGKWYCVVAAVYPAHSGASTNMNGSNGNAGSDSWRLSAPDCVQIAKRPSFQVWGGSMFTAGNITSNPGIKRTIYGFHNYNYTDSSNKDNATVFGSWVEQAVVQPKSTVSGVASGAATGLYGAVNGNRSDVSGLGGSHEGSVANSQGYCKYRVPLSMPNDKCDGVSNSGVTTNTTTNPADKSALIARFSNTESKNYELKTNVTELGGVSVSKNTTTVYKTDGSFRITGDIKYDSDSDYQTITEIPKLIIYARNINITCSVKRIDAVLIADEAVNTCEPSSDNNSGERANQLKIFGTVIANKITLGRTYGAAAGIYNHGEQAGQAGGVMGQESSYKITNGSAASVVPAEIIDYDTSLYLWGAPRANASTSGKLDITYQTELAPRY